MYFVITTNEDGDVYLQHMTKDKLLQELTPDKDGYAELPVAKIHGLVAPFQTLQERAGTYIIKGELVVPKPKKVVETFEVE